MAELAGLKIIYKMRAWKRYRWLSMREIGEVCYPVAAGEFHGE